MSTSTTRRILTATGAAALAGVALGAAPASAEVSSDDLIGVARIYADDQYLFVTGAPDFVEGCSGDVPMFPAHAVDTPSGRYSVTAHASNPAALYDISNLGAADLFELIDIICDPAFGADPLVPLASGTAQDFVHLWGAADGSGAEKDVSRGTVQAPDGTTYRVLATSIGQFDSPDALPDYRQTLVVTEVP